MQRPPRKNADQFRFQPSAMGNAFYILMIALGVGAVASFIVNSLLPFGIAIPVGFLAACIVWAGTNAARAKQDT